MADARSIATAAEAYAVDVNRYPAAAGVYSLPSGFGTTIPTTTLLQPIQLALQPTYIRILPLKDGWNSWFLYSQVSNQQDYLIASAGKDGVVATFIGGPTTDFNADIVFADGQFCQFPEGMQK